jgi:N-acetylglucosamine-6-phosphate deacetylase
LEDILGAVRSVREFRGKWPGVLGMHLEGPFLNERKKGAHCLEMIRKPTDEEVKMVIEEGKDVIKVITIAP